LSWLHLPRNLHVDFHSWHRSVFVSISSNLELASELVRKVFTPPWSLLNVESTLIAWFWRVFINVSKTLDLRLGDPGYWSLRLLEVLCSTCGSIFCFLDVVERSWWSFKHVAKIVASDLREVLQEELWSTIIKVRVSVLVSLYVCYSSRHKWMRGRTHSREASYSGFYTLEDF
jgi:hypothetical protein